MDKKQAAVFDAAAHKEVQAVRRLMRSLENKGNSSDQVAAFDSMLASNPQGREAAMSELPESLQRILNSKYMAEDKQAVFDGLEDGIIEFKRRNGGEMPSEYAIAAALTTAAAPFGGGENFLTA